jgi:hypothetical protein
MQLKEFYPTTKDVARVLCSINRKLFKKWLLKNPLRCKKDAVWMDYDKTKSMERKDDDILLSLYPEIDRGN